MTPGARPTTARLDGRDSMPLLTISAIISTATNSHDRVLYWIYESQHTMEKERIGKSIKPHDPLHGRTHLHPGYRLIQYRSHPPPTKAKIEGTSRISPSLTRQRCLKRMQSLLLQDEDILEHGPVKLHILELRSTSYDLPDRGIRRSRDTLIDI